jgi:hypothetical protein
MLEWFSGESEFYPSFHDALAEEIIEMYREEEEEEQEEK